ncbi:MAG: Ldh family oxidoreductase [Spirochaetota bacterium]
MAKSYLSFDYLEQFMRDVLLGVGVPNDDAVICARVLIESDKRGIDSHGIGRLKPIYYDRIKAGILNTKTNVEIVRDKMTTAVLDGHNGMGFVVAEKAMRMAIAKAKQFGLGMTVARNSTHYGIAGYYPLMAVKEDMIGITGTNARPSIAPTFGVENMLGTNPLTFGIPTDEPFPFVLDCATSITQRGKIEVYDRLHKPMPAGWVIGEDGGTKTDAHTVLDELIKGTAALTPLGGIGEELGGYKGYGYATVVEILSSALASGNFMKALLGMKDGKKAPIELGHFFIAINIDFFIDIADFKKNTGTVLRELRASKKAPGAKRIYTAGEKEYDAFCEREKTGVPIDDELAKDMIAMRNELSLDYRFPFEGK